VRSTPVAHWDRPDASTHAAPAAVVAEAPVRGTVRVVTVRTVAGRPRVEVRTVDGRAAAANAVSASQRAAGVVSVSLDQRVRVNAVRSDDPQRPAQWGLDRLKAEDVWARRTGAGVTVAVVDTGVQADHPDLAGVVLRGTDLVTAGGDGSADGQGHGTHVAGIVGAVANNRVGVAGFAQGVKILPVRVLGNDGSGWNSDIAKGIVYAADHGAAVVNLSLGGSSSDGASADAVRYALARNVVVVAAAGNERRSGSPTSYPAAYPGVLAVAATDSADRVASFSTAGSYVDVAAPGVQILSTVRGSSYTTMSGTSMATPFVAAAVAILKAADPALTPARAAQVLESTAVDLGPAGRDNDTGYGLIDPAAALCTVMSCGGSPTPSPSTPSPSTPSPSTPSPSTPSPSPSTPSPSPSTPTPSPTAATVTTMVSRSAAVRYGSTVTATARVLDARRGAGLAGVPVQLCVKTAPATTYGCRTYTTDFRGNASHRFTAGATTSVYAVHPGTVRTTSSASTVIAYTVSPDARVWSKRGGVTATVNPAAHQVVHLQRWNGRAWAGVTSSTVDGRGTAAFTGLARAYYRVQVPTTATLTGMTTGYVWVS
jgi:type VII secretion-associated serine protease mycosin